MRPPPRRRRHPAVRLQRQPNPVVAARDAVLGHQLLVEVFGREIEIAGVEQLQQTRHLVHRRPARRDRAQPPVKKTLRTRRFVTIAPAPERALRHPQNLRRLRLAQPAPAGASVNLLELHQA